jgi:hypothetical protein
MDRRCWEIATDPIEEDFVPVARDRLRTVDRGLTSVVIGAEDRRCRDRQGRQGDEDRQDFAGRHDVDSSVQEATDTSAEW